MGYIIVWQHGYREPHIHLDSHYKAEVFSSYENAKEEADRTVEAEGKDSEWYYDYAIYEEVNS